MKAIKKILPRSLFYRSLLILTLPIILILSISTYVFFDRHWEKMAGRLAAGVAGEAAFIADYIENNDQQIALDALSVKSLHHMELNVKYLADTNMKQERLQYTGRENTIKGFLNAELSEKLNKPFRIVVDSNEK
ncbi:MAG: hypothetical protein AAF244_02490, partial [Pseudomonadota bacterium]